MDPDDNPATRPMVHDVSRTLRPGMPVWPGDPPVELVPWTSIDQSGYRLHVLRVGEHTGTHIGAPSHYVVDGASLDQLDLAHFVGLAVILDADAAQDVDALTTALEAIEATACTHLLLDMPGPDDPYDERAPGLTEACFDAACAALPELRCVGTTRPNLDPGLAITVGTRAAERGLSHLESLHGLDRLPGGRLLEIFVGCPITVGATGSPCRVLIRT